MFDKRVAMVSMVFTSAIIFATSARAQWGTVLDTLSPIAHAAVVESEIDISSALPTSAALHEVTRNADGLFYVQATVNGKRMRFLVDTGASVTVLTAADARSLGVMPNGGRYDASVETVGGTTRMAWTTLAKVELAGREIRNLKAAVVENGLGVSLLGQNILAHIDSITIRADRLSIR